MSKFKIRVVLVSMVTLFLTACGGGGSDPVQVKPPPIQKADLIIISPGSGGATLRVTAGQSFQATYVDLKCPQKADGRCDNPRRLSAVFPKSTLPITGGVVWMGDTYIGWYSQNADGKGGTWTPNPEIGELVIVVPMTLTIDAWVSLDAKGGEEGNLNFDIATDAVNPAFDMQPTIISVVAGAGTISGVSSEQFSLVGYGEMAGFDFTCPAFLSGCRVTKFGAQVTASIVGVKQVDLWIGSEFWNQHDVTPAMVQNGSFSYVVESLSGTIPAGKTIRISMKSSALVGKASVYFLEVVDAASGLPLNFTGVQCAGSVMFRCKG